VNAFWAYFWPVFGAGLLAGAIGASIAYRRKRNTAVTWIAALAIALAAAWLWHGPLGAADRFSAKVERDARQTLVAWEMTQVHAELQRDPLTRRVLLSGEADDFQRGELVRIIGAVPGVSSATWTARRAVPLIAEGCGVATLGYLLGLLLAYLIELRRRYNAHWNW
jgi:hypothetical protein